MIVGFGAPREVSSETPLLDWFNVEPYRLVALRFALVNLDITSKAYLLIETSQDGEHPDDAAAVVEALPGKQGSRSLDTHDVGRWFRLSGYSEAPTHPVVLVQWEVSGIDHHGR